MCCVILGTLKALITNSTYTSQTIFIPQNIENNNGGISGVASLVGINMSSNLSGIREIPPSIYPEIGDSPNFKRKVLDSYIDFDKEVKLIDFINDYYKINEDTYEEKSEMYVSESEEQRFKLVSKLVSIEFDQNEGFVIISSETPVSEYSAILTKNAREILQEIIIENKIESAKQTLRFSQKQLNEKKNELSEIQLKLAYFKDSNLNLVNTNFINEQNELEDNLQIIKSVVTELSKQVEEAKLQVSKDTPVFSTIKEAVIANNRTKPKRKQTELLFGIAGFVFSCFIISIKIL